MKKKTDHTKKSKDLESEADDLLEGDESPQDTEEAISDLSDTKKAVKKPPTSTTTPRRVAEILKRAKRPSVVLRQSKVLKKLSENVLNPDGTKKTRQQIMKEEGYSDSYAKTGNIKGTKSWADLLEEYLPDEELGKHHKLLMNASKIGSQTFSMGVKDEEIIEVVNSFGFEVMKILFVKGLGKVAYYPIPDNIAKKYALEMAHKLKQKYGDITIRHKFGELSDEELEAELAREVAEGLGLEEGDIEKEAGE